MLAPPAKPKLPSVQNIHGRPADKVQALQRQTAAALGLAVVFRDPLRDGGEEPAMVVIPAGVFLIVNGFQTRPARRIACAVRGGSWNNGPRWLRWAVRGGNFTLYNCLGVRLARLL